MKACLAKSRHRSLLSRNASPPDDAIPTVMMETSAAPLRCRVIDHHGFIFDSYACSVTVKGIIVIVISSIDSKGKLYHRRECHLGQKSDIDYGAPATKHNAISHSASYIETHWQLTDIIRRSIL